MSAPEARADSERRERVELDLRSAEARLETAVWGAGMGLWELDFEHDQTCWFGDWCERLELNACAGADHVARWDSHIHPEDVGQASGHFSDHVAGKEDYYDAEYRIRDRKGRWRWLFERGRVVERRPDGTAVRMVGVCMDIDARKAAELDLSRSRKRLEVALESARGGMWDLDVARGEPHQTEFFYRMLGVEPALAAAQDDFWSSRVHPEDLPRVREALRRTVTGEAERYEAEYRLRHEDGTWRWVLDRGRAPERDASGHAQRLVGFVVDITTRKLAEYERQSLEREITEIANREQTRIGSDLHDGLGQDLTGIALMLRGMAAQLAKERSAVRLDDVIGLVNGAIESTRALARGLSP